MMKYLIYRGIDGSALCKVKAATDLDLVESMPDEDSFRFGVKAQSVEQEEYEATEVVSQGDYSPKIDEVRYYCGLNSQGVFVGRINPETNSGFWEEVDSSEVYVEHFADLRNAVRTAVEKSDEVYGKVKYIRFQGLTESQEGMCRNIISTEKEKYEEREFE